MKKNYTVDDVKKIVYASMNSLRKKEVAEVQEYVAKGYKLIQNANRM